MTERKVNKKDKTEWEKQYKDLNSEGKIYTEDTGEKKSDMRYSRKYYREKKAIARMYDDGVRETMIGIWTVWGKLV